MGKKIGWAVVIIIVVVLIVILSGSKNQEGATDKSPITIGFVGPLNGDLANLGLNAKSAVEIAVDEVNGAGGINGRPLQVIYEDGKCNGADASQAGNKLINVDHVPVILGGACSGETLAIAPIAEQTKTTMLSYCSSAPKVTEAGDYIFRDYPSDTYQGSYGAKFVKEQLGKTKVAILNVKTDWGDGIAGVFKKSFTEMGGTIVAEESFEQTSHDLRAQLAKIKAAKPELVYFLSYTDASIPGLKQAADMKLNVPMLGGDAWDDPKIWADVGTIGEGAMYTVVSAAHGDTLGAKLKAKTGSEEVIACTPGAYDGIYILADIMKKVGTDSTAIKNALYQTNYKGGVSSDEIKFDINGDVVGANYVVKVVKAGMAAPME